MSWGANFPHKNGPIPLWLATYLVTLKSDPPPPICPSKSYKYDNYDKTRYKVSPLLLDPPGKRDYQGIHCPIANFGPLSRGRITNPTDHCVWYLFDPKVSGSLGLSQGPFSSECSALANFSMSLACKYVNVKEPDNQRKRMGHHYNFFKKVDRRYMKSPTPEVKRAKGVFQIQSPICGDNFSNNISITQVRVNERKN